MGDMDELRYRAPALAVGFLLIAATGLAAWFFLVREDESASAVLGESEAVSPSELAEFARSVEQPVYWTGEQPGATYELTHEADGRIYVRYLTEGAEPGDERPLYLTVGTYPVPDAYAVLKSAAKQEGAIAEKAPGGALVVSHETRPTSVYLAEPDSGYQIEVYDPSPERALEVALSGDIQPID